MLAPQVQTTNTHPMIQPISIGVFIDGGYFAEVAMDAKAAGVNLGINQLLKFCKSYLAEHYAFDENDAHITEKHFYRGRYYAKAAKEKGITDREREFEDTMITDDVVFHYKHLRTSPSNPLRVIEKGVDVWFALDTYEITIARDLDLVVVITGDGDHEMLLAKIKALKKRAILLTYNAGEENSVAKLLREEASLHIELSEVLRESGRYLNFFR